MLKLRDRKNVERKMKNGDIKYNLKMKKFVFVSDEEKELELRMKDGGGDDDEYDDEMEENSDEEEMVKKEEKKGKGKKAKKPKQKK